MADFKKKCSSFRFNFFLSVLLCLPAAITANISSDRQVLLAFADAVHHGRRLNWDRKIPVCSSWIGVVCTHDQTHVHALRLPGVGLFGSIPDDTLGKLDHLRILSLRSNLLNGNLPHDIFSLPSLQYIYLQNNNFSGSLPPAIPSGLISLDLSYNSVTGEIPAAIGNHSQLSVLYLQNNFLSGSIPDLKLPKLKHLNLSKNNFNGYIPFSLQKFPSSSFLGNTHLCGPPLVQCSTVLAPSLPISPSVQHERKKIKAGLLIAIVSGVLALVFLFAAILFVCIFKKNDEVRGESKDKVSAFGRMEKIKEDSSSGVQGAKRNKLTFFEGCTYNFDLEDLLQASAEVLGKGSYGTAYRAALEDGTTVVVKRLKEVVAGKKEFEQQMEIIGEVGRHPNLVLPSAYYYSKDEKILVNDYIRTGSLSNFLHGDRGIEKTPLDWNSRVKIMLGTAHGIAHIHSFNGGKFIHGNIKSSNIFLTQDLNPIVSDYGLAPLMSHHHPPVNLSRVIAGYRAPETLRKNTQQQQQQQSDVYSFGVLLLEMLTGKAPLQSQRHDHDILDLPRWVQSVVREEWTAEVFDVELIKSQTPEEEMVQMLQIAMACIARYPDQRPRMEDVVTMIEAVRRLESMSRPFSKDKLEDYNVQTDENLRLLLGVPK